MRRDTTCAGVGSGLRAGRMQSLHSPLRPQLGVAVPAKVLPRVPSPAKGGPDEDPEPVLLFFGIVDFLQVLRMASSCSLLGRLTTERIVIYGSACPSCPGLGHPCGPAEPPARQLARVLPLLPARNLPTSSLLRY